MASLATIANVKSATIVVRPATDPKQTTALPAQKDKPYRKVPASRLKHSRKAIVKIQRKRNKIIRMLKRIEGERDKS